MFQTKNDNNWPYSCQVEVKNVKLLIEKEHHTTHDDGRGSIAIGHRKKIYLCDKSDITLSSDFVNTLLNHPCLCLIIQNDLILINICIPR